MRAKLLPWLLLEPILVLFDLHSQTNRLGSSLQLSKSSIVSRPAKPHPLVQLGYRPITNYFGQHPIIILLVALKSSSLFLSGLLRS